MQASPDNGAIPDADPFDESLPPSHRQAERLGLFALEERHKQEIVIALLHCDPKHCSLVPPEDMAAYLAKMSKGDINQWEYDRPTLVYPGKVRVTISVEDRPIRKEEWDDVIFMHPYRDEFYTNLELSSSRSWFYSKDTPNMLSCYKSSDQPLYFCRVSGEITGEHRYVGGTDPIRKSILTIEGALSLRNSLTIKGSMPDKAKNVSITIEPLELEEMRAIPLSTIYENGLANVRSDDDRSWHIQWLFWKTIADISGSELKEARVKDPDDDYCFLFSAFDRDLGFNYQMRYIGGGYSVQIKGPSTKKKKAMFERGQELEMIEFLRQGKEM